MSLRLIWFGLSFGLERNAEKIDLYTFAPQAIQLSRLPAQVTLCSLLVAEESHERNMIPGTTMRTTISVEDPFGRDVLSGSLDSPIDPKTWPHLPHRIHASSDFPLMVNTAGFHRVRCRVDLEDHDSVSGSAKIYLTDQSPTAAPSL